MTVSAPQATGRFNPALEGLRAVAAIGVMTTHVAFQTGVDPHGHAGGILSRFDFFVPVFFTLSAFLLWRRHGTAAGRARTRWRVYAVRRLARILPAYLVVVGLVLLCHAPDFRLPAATRIATVTMTQIYVPAGLAPGLTHLWSLCVEVAFYGLLPVLAVAAAPLKGTKTRLAACAAVAVLSLGWAWLPWVAAGPADGAVNRQIWPPAFACWFAVGIAAAEIEPATARTAGWLIRCRWVFWLVGLATLWVASREWYGPVGLVHPDPAAFTRRIIAGTVFTAVVVVPYALAPGTGMLTSPVAQALGRWSYAIFLVHLPVMETVMTLTGIPLFGGHSLAVWLVTLVEAAYFLGTVFYVKSAIRERRSVGFWRVSVGFHALAAVGLAFVHWWFGVLFALLALRAAIVPRRGWTPKQLGIGEVVASLVVVGSVLLVLA